MPDIKPTDPGLQQVMAAFDAAFKTKPEAEPAPEKKTVEPAATPTKAEATPAPAKAPEKKEAAPATEPENTEMVPSFTAAQKAVHERNKQDWETLREAKRTAEARATQLESDLKTKFVAREEHDRVLAELKEVQRIMAEVALERDPRFQAQFQPEMEAASAAAREAVPSEFQAEVDAILKSDPRWRRERLKKLAETLDPTDQAMLANAISNYDLVERRKNAKLKEAPQLWEKRQAEALAQQADFARRSQEAFELEMAKAEQDLPILKQREGDEPYNQQIELAKKRIKFAYSQASDPSDFAKIAVWSGVAPLLLSSWYSDKTVLEQKVAELQKELEGLRGKAPSLADGGGGENSAPDGGEPHESSIAGMVKRAFAKAS